MITLFYETYETLLVLILSQVEIIATMSAGRYGNEELLRYFEAQIVPEKEELKRIIAILKPDLDKLFHFLKKHDPRLCQQVANVGSYYQGLKVRRSDIFDYTICIDIPRDVVSLAKDSASWSYPVVNPTLCFVHAGSGKLFYGFKGHDSDKEHLAHTKPQVRSINQSIYYRAAWNATRS